MFCQFTLAHVVSTLPGRAPPSLRRLCHRRPCSVVENPIQTADATVVSRRAGGVNWASVKKRSMQTVKLGSDKIIQFLSAYAG